LVTYWFERARALLEAKHFKRAGLVATQAIRRGANRVVLDCVAQVAVIFDAWADEPWVVDGAAVGVSLVCFGTDAANSILRLNGKPVSAIHCDLSGGTLELISATRLSENAGVCFQGPVKVGAFDVSGAEARGWLQMPLNPNGRSNADVVRPWLNGKDITDRPSDTWIVDFNEMSEAVAAFYEAPFEYVRAKVKSFRDVNNRARRRRVWWQHGETVPGLRAKAARVTRVIGTPRVAKHRFFVWIAPQVLPDSRVNVIVRDDDAMFGLLHARFHVAWSLALGSRHGGGVGRRSSNYNSETCFGTFPFPEGLTPNRPEAEYADDPRAIAIAEAARRLNELREAWLNPSDLVKLVPEVVPGYPDRIVPVGPKAAVILKKRTLTNLYNERPAWLDNAHRDLDAAVAAAYRRPADISEEDALARLLALNLKRAGRQ
jgi:type II restriction/modification system DNA methylase subunit YeeA